MNRTRARAFTLTELLVVITILLVLAGILLTALSAARAKGYAATCMSNQRQMGIAMVQFANDHQGRFPTQEEIDSLSWLTVPPLRCPRVEQDDFRGINGYAFNAHLLSQGYTKPDADIDTVTEPSTVPLFSEQMGGISATMDGWAEDQFRCEGCGPKDYKPGYNRHFGGSHVTFMDTHTKWYSATALYKLPFDWKIRE